MFSLLASEGYPFDRVSKAIAVLVGRHARGDEADGPGWDDRRGDEERWTPGPEPEPFEPDPADVEWLNTAGPTDADYDEAAGYAAWQDFIEGLARFSDDDIVTACGGCG